MKENSFNFEKIFWEIFTKQLPAMLGMVRHFFPNKKNDQLLIVLEASWKCWEIKERFASSNSEDQIRINLQTKLMVETRNISLEIMNRISPSLQELFQVNSFIAPLLGEKILENFSSTLNVFSGKEIIGLYIQGDRIENMSLLVEQLFRLRIACYQEISSDSNQKVSKVEFEQSVVPILYCIVGAMPVGRFLLTMRKNCKDAFQDYMKNFSWDNAHLPELQQIFHKILVEQ